MRKLNFLGSFGAVGLGTDTGDSNRGRSSPAGQSSPRVGEVVQRGEAEIGIQPISELLEVADIDAIES